MMRAINRMPSPTQQAAEKRNDRCCTRSKELFGDGRLIRLHLAHRERRQGGAAMVEYSPQTRHRKCSSVHRAHLNRGRPAFAAVGDLQRTQKMRRVPPAHDDVCCRPQLAHRQVLRCSATWRIRLHASHFANSHAILQFTQSKRPVVLGTRCVVLQTAQATDTPRSDSLPCPGGVPRSCREPLRSSLSRRHARCTSYPRRFATSPSVSQARLT
jgi:hypothetical protein